MDNQKDEEQDTVRIVYPVEQNIEVNIHVSLTETGYYLNEHQDEENGIHYFEKLLFHSIQV